MSGQRSRPRKRRSWPQGALKELASRRRWCERARRTSAGRRRVVRTSSHSPLLLVPDSLVGAITGLSGISIFSLLILIIFLCAHGVSPQIFSASTAFPLRDT